MPKPLHPIFKKYDHEAGHWVWGLNKEDFLRVQKGYACGRCLEPFDFYVASCPVCGNEIETIVDTPSEWRG